MGRKARFRRVASTPITLRLDGVPTKIPPNGTFISTVEMVGSLPGLRFESFIDQEQSTTTKPCDPIREWNDVVSKRVSDEVADKNIDEILKNSITTPEVTPQVTPEVTPQVTPEVTTEVEVPKEGISVDVLMELKKKDNRAWMVMTKKELKSIMVEAGIDFSHVEDDRNQLYKFLSGIVKSI
jgi:hypothetical protein